MPCQGCTERREWIKKWIAVGAERAKALLGGSAVAVAVVDIVEPIIEEQLSEIIEDGRTDTSVDYSEPVIEQTGRRSNGTE